MNYVMKCLLLPKDGKARFISKDPFEHITSMGMKPVYDYFNQTLVDDINIHDYFPIESMRLLGKKYYIIIFNENETSEQEDKAMGKDVNKLASAFYRAFEGVPEYETEIGKYIYSDAMIVKVAWGDNESERIVPFTEDDKKELRMIIRDVRKWFQ